MQADTVRLSRHGEHMLKNGPGIVLAGLVCQPGNGAKNVQKYPKAPLPSISILNLPKTNKTTIDRTAICGFFSSKRSTPSQLQMQ